MFSVATQKHSFMSDASFLALKPYFLVDDATRYDDDFGHLVSRTPLGIFMPRTVEQLQTFLHIASKYQIKVTCRGKGNSAYGQSQVEGGVIIDLKNLDASLQFTNENSAVIVPAYRTWQEVTDFTLGLNKTVPVTVDNLDLTVGGTLSFGAVGGASYRCGSGADNVISLDVVTVDGERHVCSATENAELFHAVLCGIGQFGIILSATIPVINAKKSVNLHFLSYEKADDFFRDQKLLCDAKLFEHLKGFVRKKNNAWEYVIEAASLYDEQADAEAVEALKKLHPTELVSQTMPYHDFINMVTKFVHALRESGKLDAPHPWYNVFIPKENIAEHLADLLGSPFLTGEEPIIVYPMHADHFRQPLFMKPASDTFYLLGALYNTSFSARNNFPVNDVLERNKLLYTRAKNLGGCRYPVDAIPFTPEDWEHHYGAQWNQLRSLKEKYDPQHLLSSGINVFPLSINEANRVKSLVIGQKSPRIVHMAL